MKKKLTIEVYGRVQGVSFRDNTVREAKELELTGFVMNRGEDTVYIEAEGTENSLILLLQWTQTGDFPAKVTGMKFEWSEFTDSFKEFTVKREGSYIRDKARGVLNLSKRALHPGEKIQVPKHVVIIPDGNRRWARSKGWKAYVGHKRGGDLKRLLTLFNASKSYGISYLSLWVLSTENWLKRDPEEVEKIFGLFRDNKGKLEGLIHKEQIRFTHLGRKDRLPQDLLEMFAHWEEATKSYDELHLQMCIDYGGRTSLVEAVKGLINDGVEEVTEEVLSTYLETKDIPDPDLIIRTAGEKRLSGIMPYEGVYSELYFTDVPFPEFDQNEFDRAILDYSARKRNFGGTHTSHLKDVDEQSLTVPLDESFQLNT